MFEVGKFYTIATGYGDQVGTSLYRVVAYEQPLLKVEGAGRETIINTASPHFAWAEISDYDGSKDPWDDF